MKNANHTDLWAFRIEQMKPLERAKSSEFNPYRVSPDGRLYLEIEALWKNGRPEEWPRGRAPGWSWIQIDGANHVRHWLALGSDIFGQSQSKSIPVHGFKESDALKAKARLDEQGLSSALIQGKAFAFCNQVFFLPDEKEFTLNSFRYEVPDMDPLSIFVGYRGQTRAYPENLSPGLFRNRNSPTAKSRKNWIRQSRIVGNILKQRFFENKNKPLTDIEAVGIMQHHCLLGPTDLLDLTYDINVAKWFALNERQQHGEYQAKRFKTASSKEEASRDASRIVLIAVRTIGSMPIPKDVWDHLHTGLSADLWEGYAESETVAQFETRPINLAPLWSEYPRRQRGFGLRGIDPMDADPHGAVVAAWEYLYHPCYFPDGWDRFGGPELTLDGRKFARGERSANLSEYLFPDPPRWFTEVKAELGWALQKLR